RDVKVKEDDGYDRERPQSVDVGAVAQAGAFLDLGVRHGSRRRAASLDRPGATPVIQQRFAARSNPPQVDSMSPTRRQVPAGLSTMPALAREFALQGQIQKILSITGKAYARR